MEKKKKQYSPFCIKWTNWEFLPWTLVYLPVAAYYSTLALRARNLFWFKAINPGIKNGGLYGWSKEQIQDLIPDDLLPISIFFTAEDSAEHILAKLAEASVTYPLIAKPNQGVRGIGVAKLLSDEDLRAYVEENQAGFQIQECIDYPVEAGVMYYQMPDSEERGILSVTLKEFLSIKGDGVSTILELMTQNFRAVMVLDKLKERFADRLEEVLLEGEELLLEPIGNHNRGTRFYSGQGLITKEMVEVYRKVNERIEGVYFCRYDLRCPSIEDLVAGRNLKVLEINGAWAEPTHIYDHRISVWGKYKMFFKQWKIMYRIARANHKRGVPYIDFIPGMKQIFTFGNLKKDTSGN